MTITATIVGGIGMLANFAMFFGGSRGAVAAWRHRRVGGDAGGAARRHARAVRDLALARIRGRPRRRGDQRAARALASALAKISSGAAQFQMRTQVQSGDRAPLHRQPVHRARRGQSVLDPPVDPEPHRPPAGARQWCRAGTHGVDHHAPLAGFPLRTTRSVEQLILQPPSSWSDSSPTIHEFQWAG